MVSRWIWVTSAVFLIGHVVLAVLALDDGEGAHAEAFRLVLFGLGISGYLVLQSKTEAISTELKKVFLGAAKSEPMFWKGLNILGRTMLGVGFLLFFFGRESDETRPFIGYILALGFASQVIVLQRAILELHFRMLHKTPDESA